MRDAVLREIADVLRAHLPDESWWMILVALSDHRFAARRSVRNEMFCIVCFLANPRGFARKAPQRSATRPPRWRSSRPARSSSSNAVWTVHFFKVLPADYLILDVDPKYQWAAVAHPSRHYGWGLARSKTLPEKQYSTILAKFAAQGYDTSKFVKVPQQPVSNPLSSQQSPPSAQAID